MSPHSPAIRWLVRLVFGVRESVLERPGARAALRVLGWPLIKLMHATVGRSPEPPPITPDARAEPVLKLPLDYRLQAVSTTRVGVLLHAFYLDVLPEIAEALRALPPTARVFVSTDDPVKAPEIERVFDDWDAGRVSVEVAPNAGRNFGPQLATLGRVADECDLVLFLHTKTSAHTTELAGWRGFLLRNLLGSPAQVAGVLEAFAQMPKLGVLAPRTYPAVRPHMVWGVNFAACRDLAERLGAAIYPDSALDFPAGGMFWARPAALRPLLQLGLSTEAFGPESGQKDGTLAHAIERLIFHTCELAGFRWARAGDEAEAASPEAMLRAETPRTLWRLMSDCGRALLVDGRRPNPTWTPDSPPPPADEERKAQFRDACRQELEAFLASGGRLVLPSAERPRVSVILVLFNQAELTYQCLRSLHFALDPRCEVILIDNASTDRTGELLDRLDGPLVVRNTQNLHFLRGVNQAAGLASGEFLLLVNNDTRLAPETVAAAVAALESAPDAGAVGGRIELLDGALQEAGSIVWRDGSCEGYGRGGDPYGPEFQFRREVDYASGALLLVRRELFERLGGFDDAFAPAYYEETDLCMRLRSIGRRTLYEPRALVTHVEFGSSVSSEAALELQARNRGTFIARHADALAAGHCAPGEGRRLEARMRGAFRGRVLIIEDQAPLPELGAGYPRALDMVRAATDAGWFVTVYPLVYADVDYEAAYRHLPREVEFAAELGRPGLDAFLKARAGYYDTVVVSRPHNMTTFRAALSKRPEFIALDRVVYDAEALFSLRDHSGARAQKALAAELKLAVGAGAVLAVTEDEARAFREAGAGDVRVLGHALEAAPTTAAFRDRRDLLFVGALDEDHSPNADSLEFFVREVMPRLDTLLGTDYRLNVAGRNGSARVRALASERVRLLGRVDDLAPLYEAARVFIAPTRFAAGIPMKVHEAAAAGVPVTATSLLARQLGWSHETHLMVADDPQDFAEACAMLYRVEATWTRVRDGALARIAADCDPEFFKAQVAGVLSKVARR